jgi:hypothetical protein
MPRKKNLAMKVRRAITRTHKLDALEMMVDSSSVHPLAGILKVDRAVLYRWQCQEEEIRMLATTQGLDVRKRHRIGNGGRLSTIRKDLESQLVSWFMIRWHLLQEKMKMQRDVFRLRELNQRFTTVPRKICQLCLWSMLHRNIKTIRAITHHSQVARIDAVMIVSLGEYVRETMRILEIDHN